MKKISPNSRSALNHAYYYLRQTQYRYGEATYYALQRYRYNPVLGTRFDLTNNYDRLGLNHLTADVFKGDSLEFAGRSYTNWELALIEARASIPRSDADLTGAWFRAFGEYSVENYIDAIKYFLLSDYWCTQCNQLIFSYLRLGEIESAEPLLEQRKNLHRAQLKAGMYRGPTGRIRTPILEINAIDLALLDSDLSKAMNYLKSAMDKGLILGRMYQKLDPLYWSLHEHPDWPALLAESEKRATVQREIYLKLVAEDDETAQ